MRWGARALAEETPVSLRVELRTIAAALSLHGGTALWTEGELGSSHSVPPLLYQEGRVQQARPREGEAEEGGSIRRKGSAVRGPALAWETHVPFKIISCLGLLCKGKWVTRMA